MRLLVIEDDEDIVRHLKRGLEDSGYEVDFAIDGGDGLAKALQEPYDAVVLNVMLPVMDGVGVVSAMRAGGNQTPVVMLTARDGVPDRIRGLDAGADDYLVKPFSFSELLARLRALIRRGGPSQKTDLAIADLRMDLVGRSVFRGDNEVILTPKEFSLLEYLIRNAGQVLTRSMILKTIWNYDFDPGTNVVDVHVRRLRLKVDEGRPLRLIQTVRGIGYVLKA